MLTDHVILYFNKNMSTAAVFLNIKKAFDKIWHIGLLYKLSKLKFSISLIQLIRFSFLTENSKFHWSWTLYVKWFTNRGVTRFCSVPNIVKYIYINDTPQNTCCLSRSLCWWHLYTCICDRRQRDLCSQKAAARSQNYWDVVWELK
jgi:hypothetical protein